MSFIELLLFHPNQLADWQLTVVYTIWLFFFEFTLYLLYIDYRFSGQHGVKTFFGLILGMIAFCCFGGVVQFFTADYFFGDTLIAVGGFLGFLLGYAVLRICDHISNRRKRRLNTKP